MEDELDDRIIYQTYVSHLKIMSRIVWSIPIKLSHLNGTSQVWRLIKCYLAKPEIILFGFLIFFLFTYIQALDLWSRNLLSRFQHGIYNQAPKIRNSNMLLSGTEKQAWEKKIGMIAAYAIQGRRPKMEDRFVIEDNINESGVSLVAVFDGHGGEFAANYAKEKLIQSIYHKIIKIKDLIAGKGDTPGVFCNVDEKKDSKESTTQVVERKNSFRRSSFSTEEKIKEITDTQILSKLNTIKPISRETKPSKSRNSIAEVPINNYFDKFGTVDYGKLITDEVLAADARLIEVARKTMDVAGTTALIAILEGDKLTVANVGDSRGVMCDSKGNAIPLSFDHKPQQVRERKRIKEAGGFVTFNGVWRVAGILATSRALGDYPLKDRKLVIAEPDILTFNLTDHKPQFLILASDGLWDTFSNEEAVHFVREHLNEPDYGVKSLTLQSFYRGSLDNITVIVINFKDKLIASFSSGN
ncbi:protein phosphatase 1L [Cylas formicarius]|uniref:protein phosphatase 1L n=1 Tax=Cylas formicarius TaxID=197179 RepID=UPI0029586E71|nr:protein phosphatase 1L [Cylas formicarius]